MPPDLQKSAFNFAMNLPAPVQRVIVGSARYDVTWSGAERETPELAVDAQMLLWLMEITNVPSPEGELEFRAHRARFDVEAGRAIFDVQSALAGGRWAVGNRRSVAVAGLPGRLYVPTGAPAVTPLMVFFHGGGFVYGGLDSHDATCRFLAEKSGVRVLAVDYRLAPENPFPAGYDDAVAAFAYVHAHADLFGADPGAIGVGGDSAGGNLATGVALRVGSACAFQLLLYPVTSDLHTTVSAEVFAEGYFLTGDFMKVAGEAYVPSGIDASDPRISPLYAAVSPETAPAYVATAGFDPLRDEAEEYAELLRAAGVPVTVRRFETVMHGFANMLGAGRSAKAATAEIATALGAISRSRGASAAARG